MSAKENPAGQGGVIENAADNELSAVQCTGPRSVSASISEEHLAELAASAIPASVAEAAGVFTAYSTAMLPSWARWIGSTADALPALVYPMREADGTETGQVKPQKGSVTSKSGRELKYVGPSKRSGNPPQLPFVGVRSGDAILTDPAELANVDRVWLVEGCKQALAAVGHVPSGVAVVRFTGVSSWIVASCVEGEPGTPTPYLPSVVAGREVAIFGDADASTNISVYDGLTALGNAAVAAGARRVVFARVPGTGKQGLDDALAELSDESTRREALVRWAGEAKAKPADLVAADLKRMRQVRSVERAQRAAEQRLSETADAGRVDLLLEGDYHVDCLAIAREVDLKLGGDVLFRRGGESVELVVDDDGQKLRVLDSDGLHRQALSAVRLTAPTLRNGVEVIEVVSGLRREPLGILKGRLAERLPNVTRISRAPVVRTDGTVVTASGYDPQTQVLVDLGPDVRGLSVPESPTDSEIAAATHLLRDELFELDGVDGFDGWVFAQEADQTHAIALLLTTLLRSAFPVVPLALADGLQSGVGKGELINVVHQVAYGERASFMATPSSDAELEKRITGLLRAGGSMIVLDEVMGPDGSKLKSPALLAALTASVWTGRVLGTSDALSMTQGAVWAATGNNVDIPGDMVRRVYTIRLSSDRPGLKERDNFRRDLGRWVPEHRCELLTAALTLIRAWYDRGQPVAPRPIGMTTFSEWQRVVGGILHLAGIEGFLSTVGAMRAQADSEALENYSHLDWVDSVAATLPGAPRFTAKEIIAAAMADPDHEAPYDRAMADLDARGLGRVWKQMAGRWYGSVRIVEDGKGHGNVVAWRVQRQTPATSSATPGATSPAPSSSPAPTAQRRSPAGASAGESVSFTDRGGFKREAARAMPAMSGLTISELGGGAS